ncbi:MAG TPA: sulfatase [Verrucomicrobiae bacterium]|nr:sulfatase [Verrucomicrobiae bacterium]
MRSGITVLWALCFVLSSQSAISARPNIIFILADDLGINDLACYGRKEHHTPNLDELAREGMRFAASYCAQPICSPSRAAILTGKAPARLHLTTYLPGRADAPSQRLLHPKIRQQLPLEQITLAEGLKTNGYATACIGKWHLGGKGFLPGDQGFDFYYPGQANTAPSDNEGGKGEYDLTRAAISFMETNRAGPFFLYLAHNSPHIPFAAKTNLITKNQKAFEPVYAAVIESLDDSVGLLMRKLDSLSLRTNTIVIFTSDNGGLHVPEGSHKRITDNSPFRAGKGFLYEGGLRVPLIVRWPGHVPAGKVVDTSVVNTSWFATLFELAGMRSPRALDAPSIAPLLLGKNLKAGRVFWHFPHYTNQGSRPGGAMRDSDWKFIEHYDTGEPELYNLATDPAESQNLAAQHPDRANRMRRQLSAWRNSMNAQTNTSNPDFKPALFHELYELVDVSQYVPTKEDSTRLIEWRRQMNAVLRK